MNKQVILLREISENSMITQRGLAQAAGLSLGSVNTLIKKSLAEGLIEGAASAKPGYILTDGGYAFLKPYRVDGAVILAAGFGSRFVPISFEKPKGLVEVFGEPMIERQVRQLIEAGIYDITIVVGYMKESFDYLTDRYGCRLIYNPDYETKNNISSVYAARDYIEGRNVYILSSDHWMRENIFHAYEGGAWYASRHFDGVSSEWTLVTDRKGRITDTYPGAKNADCMYGPAYFSREFSSGFMPVLKLEYAMPGTGDYYWEHVLMEMLNGSAAKRINAFYGRVPEIALCSGAEIYINRQPPDCVYEFESLEELRDFDPVYMENSGSEAMKLVSSVFHVPEAGIRRIRRLKAGMTNNSWLFSVGDRSYICRIPGQGTELLINRHEEKAALSAVKDLGLTEKLIYFDENTGYKISEYYEGSRCADPLSAEDMSCCMRKLRFLHGSGARVQHRFDIGAKLKYYEELCGGTGRIPFGDYPEISIQKERLLAWLNGLKRPETLCHVDSVADNFIFLKGADREDGSRDESLIRLIDWEYAGMSDPLIDIGMCAIYSYMEEDGASMLMSAYLGREPTEEERLAVYAYMALGGLLWALWGVYKESLGVNFTDYTIKMYRYFKKYSKKVLL